MKVLSLFDGISCARVALERAGILVELYWAVEIDKYATQISQKNYPDIVRTSDVKNFVGEEGSFDLIIGGSPCQDLSIAKKDRKGLDGERSGLFWEYVRILKEIKPKYFILENVASMSKEAKQTITEALGVEPIMINASLVSAQNRKRLFWTNIPNIVQPQDRGILLKDILEKEVDNKYYLSEREINYMKGDSGNYSSRTAFLNDSEKEKSLALVANLHKGVPYNVLKIGHINKTDGQANRVYSPEGKGVTLSALSGGLGAKTGLYAVALRNRGEGKKPEIGGDKANAMTTVQTDSMVMEDFQIRKLTPIECERLQGLPDNYTDGVSNTQRYKSLGNAFNVDVIAHILSFIP